MPAGSYRFYRFIFFLKESPILDRHRARTLARFLPLLKAGIGESTDEPKPIKLTNRSQ